MQNIKPVGFKPSSTEAQVTMKTSQGLQERTGGPGLHMIWIIRLQLKEFHFYLWVSAPHKISFCKQFPMLGQRAILLGWTWVLGERVIAFNQQGRRECWRPSPNKNKTTETATYWGRGVRYYTMFSCIISNLISTWALRDLENWKQIELQIW